MEQQQHLHEFWVEKCFTVRTLKLVKYKNLIYIVKYGIEINKKIDILYLKYTLIQMRFHLLLQ